MIHRRLPAPIVFVGCGVVAIATFFLVPVGLASAVIYALIGAASGTTIMLAASRKTRARGAWALLGAGQLLWALGDVTWAGYELVLQRPAPYPSIADAVYLCGYICAIAGVLMLVGRHRATARRYVVMDWTMVALPIGLIAWETVVGGYVGAMGNDPVTRLVSVGYPLMDLALLGAAVVLMLAPRAERATRLLSSALCLLLVADVLYNLDLFKGTYHPGIWYDGFWLLSYVLCAGAALYPSRRVADDARRPGEHPGTRPLHVFMLIAALAGTYAWKYTRGNEIDVDVAVVVGGSILVLALIRMATQTRIALENESSYQTLLEHASDAILVSKDGCYLEVNQTACELTGYRRSELEGLPVRALVPDEAGVDRHSDQAAELAASGSRLLRKDGSVVIVESRSRRMTDGRELAIVRDVTERKTAEEAHRTSEARFRSAFRSRAIGVVLETRTGDFMEVNDTFAAMLGFEPGELIGSSSASVTFPDDSEFVVNALDMLAGRGLDEVHIEKRYLHKDGRVVPASVHIGLVRDARGAPEYAVAHVMELTRQRELEESLNQARKMEAIGQLAGGIAHDFNNLLSVISNCTQFAYDDLSEGDVRKEDLGEVLSASVRAGELVKQLLAFSRSDEVHTEVIDVNEVVEGLEGLLRRTVPENVEMAFQIANAPNRVMMDRVRLEQVVVNLVVNARDALGGGGHLAIQTGHAVIDADKASLLRVQPGHYAVLVVADDGCGMPLHVRDRIFEPFFTTKPPGSGTGLGLATVYGIVEQIGGAVAVESTPQEGALFRVYIPATDSAPVASRQEVSRKGHGGRGTILVVDDEAAIQRIIQRVLSGHGYAVLAPASPEEALEIAGRSGTVLDLVITDVVMPRISGCELVERIREITPSVPAIFVSGYTSDVMEGRGMATGDLQLPKPFTPDELLRAVSEVMARGESTRAAGRLVRSPTVASAAP